ncbi:MAG TPA: DNA recombination protein RmuC [Syntrophales bacterium]|nr:DNA recombination protein RmuC [Syntrophales bacterium]
MDSSIFYFMAGMVMGATGALVFVSVRWQNAEGLARSILDETDRHRSAEFDRLSNHMKDSFGALSLQALYRNSEEFLKMARETLGNQMEMGGRELESKKALIDQVLGGMKGDLLKVQELITTFEKDREQKFGELKFQMGHAAEQTRMLRETAEGLRSALTNTKIRGQWGERMAEDVLRASGLVEGVNYVKQETQESTGKRPDYTFFLPGGKKVHMDVKFPLDNYLRFVEAEGDEERERCKTQFLRDVRLRIRDVSTREYVRPEDQTVDCLIVFIPNEQVFAFIHECDATIMDEAMARQVVLCSPVTLYAVLAVIRRGVENFHLEKTASRILTLFSSFYRQWNGFVGTMERMGKKIEEAQREYEALVSVRRNQLERSLLKIEEMRKAKNLPDDEPPDGEDLPLT